MCSGVLLFVSALCYPLFLPIKSSIKTPLGSKSINAFHLDKKLSKRAIEGLQEFFDNPNCKSCTVSAIIFASSQHYWETQTLHHQLSHWSYLCMIYCHGQNPSCKLLRKFCQRGISPSKKIYNRGLELKATCPNWPLQSKENDEMINWDMLWPEVAILLYHQPTPEEFALLLECSCRMQ